MTLTVGKHNLDTIVRWTKEKEVSTRRGQRFLSTAKLKTDGVFWEAWRDHKSAMQAAGISVSKDKFSNDWVACRWRELPVEELERRAKSVEQSRATDADIIIPCNEGMSYMPFQRGGISFILEKFNQSRSAQSEGGSPFCPGVLVGDEMGLWEKQSQLWAS